MSPKKQKTIPGVNFYISFGTSHVHKLQCTKNLNCRNLWWAKTNMIQQQWVNPDVVELRICSWYLPLLKAFLQHLKEAQPFVVSFPTLCKKFPDYGLLLKGLWADNLEKWKLTRAIRLFSTIHSTREFEDQ